MTTIDDRIAEALSVLRALDFPRGQLNDRSALCLLALLDIKPDQEWGQVANPLIGITPMMEFAERYYGRLYKPNSRESFRRQTIHQFKDAGLALINPDNPTRAINSPATVYQVEPTALELLKSFGDASWSKKLSAYRKKQVSLAQRYAKARTMNLIPVRLLDGQTLQLSAGDHSQLIADILKEFAPRFAPGSTLIYVGDTGKKMGHLEAEILAALGVSVDLHGKMPDVVLYWRDRNWLFLIESVTSHGPVDAKRYGELAAMFGLSTAGLVYVTAFPTRALMARRLSEIAWETEVWVADDPAHLIHFNGDKFLGPHAPIAE